MNDPQPPGWGFHTISRSACGRFESLIARTPLIVNLLTKLNRAYHWPARVHSHGFLELAPEAGSMADDFKYDVFLSHSSKDKDVVRAIAERLRADGLRGET